MSELGSGFRSLVGQMPCRPSCTHWIGIESCHTGGLGFGVGDELGPVAGEGRSGRSGSGMPCPIHQQCATETVEVCLCPLHLDARWALTWHALVDLRLPLGSAVQLSGFW